jgi:fused signal recognition particle receptor
MIMFGFLRSNKEDNTATADEANESLATAPKPAIKSGASFTPASLRTSTPAPVETEKTSTPETPVEKTEPPTEETKDSTDSIPEITEVTKSGASFTAPTAEDWAEVDDDWALNQLKSGLSKTRHGLTDGMADLVLGKKVIDDDLLEELETRLLMADVGIDATDKIITDLTKRISRKELNEPVALFEALCDDMEAILKPCDAPLVIDKTKSPFVILIIGINGAGKTTTIGKLAKRFQEQGLSVMLAAGDTFRAAAVEQLQTWGERNDIPVVSQGTGADSASVIYDAIESARAKNVDIVIADTAGRLHTQSHLMDELIKIKRVMKKLDVDAPHETILVMDAGFGQNGLIQAQEFNDAMGITGLILTKLDGTAKGGILFAIAEKLGIAIRFIGVGEKIGDLREFNGRDFVDALLDRDRSDV